MSLINPCCLNFAALCDDVQELLQVHKSQVSSAEEGGTVSRGSRDGDHHVRGHSHTCEPCGGLQRKQP